MTHSTVFLQKAEKKWEEKRQNLDHYNGQEFEKLLEEAQANIMKSIPKLEMPPQSTVMPKGDAADKLEVPDKVCHGKLMQTKGLHIWEMKREKLFFELKR